MEAVYKAEKDVYSDSLTAIGWRPPMGHTYYTYAITSSNTNGFSASATGDIDGDAANDVWTIDQDGVLTNTTPD